MCFKVRPCIFAIRQLTCVLFLHLPLDGTIGLQSMSDLSNPMKTLFYISL